MSRIAPAVLALSTLASAPSAFAVTAAPAAGQPIRLAMLEGMSGPFANGGAAIERNLRYAIDALNARGGVRLPDGAHPLELAVFDTKGTPDQALAQLRAAEDAHIPFILQGNSSAVAAALESAIDKHNAREPDTRVLFLNYSAVDPALTNERCSFWHFRFDAHAGMRMNALTDVIEGDKSVKKVYLIDQDYSFGHDVSTLARGMLAAKRPDIAIVGDEFHPVGKVTDFTPYISKIRDSGADAVITGNYGNDLTLLVKAAHDGGLKVRFYTFYANSLGAAAAIGDAGVGRVEAVAEWHQNVEGAGSDAFYAGYRARWPNPADDWPVLRVTVMIDMLAQAIEKAKSTDAAAVAHALEDAHLDPGASFHPSWMRPDDHQLMQPLYVMEMAKQGAPGVPHDAEGSGYGFKTVKTFEPDQTRLPTTCKMTRP
ncbi:branched-chain amino acid ABC transporter substrate-binding protein [Pararobbsia silviterrae]|uniref:Branched-chain amino acid ABC transporter substrate-binding protein n=1 Tax=Pararobbsia silviterrae TaxID=1792498 RepID=A0A494Y5A9_9BURK|nr:branched-chain amino acid ABC transporter substrate-binding protein [Pararobbsia silviterrae]RKP57868.1 branched-chain amino acid ABC transporter substrate-binding protein [Pararobbsia silviterrae]